MSETADKMLEMARDLGAQLAATFKDVSPEVWRAAQEKVVADAYVHFLVAACILVVVGFVAPKVRLILRAAKDDDDLYGAAVVLSGVGAVLVGASVYQVASGIRMLVARDWYTIEQLMSVVR